MGNTPIISIVASFSGTGKTTFIIKLIEELVERGYKIGTIKNTKEFQIDKEGKDSYRHKKAGASAVAVVGSEGYAFIEDTKVRKGLDEVASLFSDVDLIISEGYKKENKPKIEVVRKEKGTQIASKEEELIAVVTDATSLDVEAPLYDLNDAKGIADLIENKFLKNKSKEFSELTHFNSQGRAHMVDVTAKKETSREAIARGEILMSRETLELLEQGKMAKGDVLAVAQVAGIMGVKKTSSLIPMCHPLLLGSVNIQFNIDSVNSKVDIECRVKMTGQTGVEMEALTGVNIAALTIYDMCKAVEKNMVINNIRLVRKTGGKSGTFQRVGEEV